jgi:hypothetical protein
MSFNLRPIDLQQHYMEGRLVPRTSWSLWQRNEEPSLPEVESLPSPELAVIFPFYFADTWCAFRDVTSCCQAELLFVLCMDCIKTFNEGSS